ncbi:hypothetical protein DEJ50_00525 [Streptomyces venezuelae]|uniref:Methyltransferase domain-containing protein n=1 Tax=Streptomyces venezuelae TaxID=54571 RepID=A0A5P2CZK7_STRVZ|nr:methyltransferase domain-containing protein [Streptomyces venezuelae]QES46561.1 hypothetical protein DEJ50_00525 [Streptomyces venezuelae]
MSTAVEQLSSTQVGAFYDRLGAYFATVYGGESNIHFGYWDDAADSAGPREAQDRLTRMALAALDLSEGGWLLDVGCGTGGPARLAATESGCSVAGVTVSRTQVERAHREAARAGLAGRVRVQYADAMQLPFPDGSFDAVWALESVSASPPTTARLSCGTARADRTPSTTGAPTPSWSSTSSPSRAPTT